MEINPGLIQKFFENKCSSEEWNAVMVYLSQHPGAMEEFFPAEEWNSIQPAQSLPGNRSEEMKQQLEAKLFPVRKAVIWPIMLKRISIAAASLLLAAAGLTLFLQNSRSKTGTAARGTGSVNIPDSTVWIQQANLTGKPLTIRLPDGSAARLQKKASLKYTRAYGTNNRDIYLEGTAFFEVARQANNAFTVWAGPLRVTALGTSFSITRSGPDTRVQLHTGKVMVQPARQLQEWQKAVYLLPGEQACYHEQGKALTVTRNKPYVTHRDTSSIPAAPVHDTDLVFNNTPLVEVMNRLSNRYHCSIIYNSHDLAGMNFTGTIARSDSLGVVLKLIAAMNELELREEQHAYLVSKPLQ
jgi:ferric-dicitrate binding protein FerR (iron transport regulator)